MNIESIRAWRPGDGVTCSRAKQAPRDIPCGPPVAVYATGPITYVRRFEAKSRSFVVCRNHLPGATTPGEVSALAKRVATEQLVVENWDRFQELIADHALRAVEEMIRELPEDLQELIKEAAE